MVPQLQFDYGYMGNGYEEPMDAEALPRFIEIPTVPTTKNPKSEKFVTMLGDAVQSTKRQCQDSQRISAIFFILLCSRGHINANS